jgi:hypothetical protein
MHRSAVCCPTSGQYAHGGGYVLELTLVLSLAACRHAALPERHRHCARR